MELCHKQYILSCLNPCVCHLLAHSAFRVTRFQCLCSQIIQQWQGFSSNFPTLQGHAWHLFKPTWKKAPTSASRDLPHKIPILTANCSVRTYQYSDIRLYNVPTSGVTQLREDQLGRSGLNIKFKLQTKIMKGYKLSDSNIWFWSANVYGIRRWSHSTDHPNCHENTWHSVKTHNF